MSVDSPNFDTLKHSPHHIAPGLKIISEVLPVVEKSESNQTFFHGMSPEALAATAQRNMIAKNLDPIRHEGTNIVRFDLPKEPNRIQRLARRVIGR